MKDNQLSKRQKKAEKKKSAEEETEFWAQMIMHHMAKGKNSSKDGTLLSSFSQASD